jgi:hypothetical protein
MKRLLLVALVVAAGVSAATWLGSSPPAAAQPPAKWPQWQYAVYDHSDLMALGEKRIGQNLTKLGEQGNGHVRKGTKASSWGRSPKAVAAARGAHDQAVSALDY